MKLAELTDRSAKLRAYANARIEALSAASTGWRMNRKVGLTFGAISAAMAALALASAGSLLLVRGPAIAGTLKSITDQAHQSGNADGSYSASVAQSQYLEMRVNVTRYLSDASPATAKLAKDNLLDLEDDMNILFDKVKGTNLSGDADKVIVELVAYDK